MAVYGINGTSIFAVYDVDGQQLNSAYNVDGSVIFYKTVDYDNFTMSAYCSVTLPNIQGFDIHNGVVFQFRGSSSVNNIMVTIDAENASIIQSGISAKSDHGDSASFSTEYFAGTDDYPLMYVTADTNPAKVYVNRVTQSSSALVKTFSFPLDKTGYYAAHAYDEANGIMYMVGYSEQNYQTDDGGNNKTVISKWDMTNLTQNQDGSYTPAYVSSFERAFILCTQGQQFHDGMIWVASGYTETSQYIYALDPADGTALHTIDLNTTTEVEGLSFLSANEMVVGFQGGTYVKYTFATA